MTEDKPFRTLVGTALLRWLSNIGLSAESTTDVAGKNRYCQSGLVVASQRSSGKNYFGGIDPRQNEQTQDAIGSRFWFKRAIEGRCSRAQRIPVIRVARRHRGHSFGQITQDVRE